MTTVRITSAKGGVEAPGRGVGAGHAADSGDADGSFAAALGALAAPAVPSAQPRQPGTEAGLGDAAGGSDGGQQTTADAATGDAAGRDGSAAIGANSQPASSILAADNSAAASVLGMPGAWAIGAGDDGSAGTVGGQPVSGRRPVAAPGADATKAAVGAALDAAVTVSAGQPAPVAPAPAAAGNSPAGLRAAASVSSAAPTPLSTDPAISPRATIGAVGASAQGGPTPSLASRQAAPSAPIPQQAPASQQTPASLQVLASLQASTSVPTRNDPTHSPAALSGTTSGLATAAPPLGIADVAAASAALVGGPADAGAPNRATDRSAAPAVPDAGAIAAPSRPEAAAPTIGAMLADAVAAGAAHGNGSGATSPGAGDRGRNATVFAVAAGQDGSGNPPARGVDPASAGAAAGPPAPDAGAATTADLADRLSHQIVRLLANSDRSAVVRLHPPELGEVTVRVAVEGRDVTAWFGAPQPLVQQTISQAIGQLHADLGGAGYNLSGAWVGADASGSGGGGANVPLPSPAALPAVPNFATARVAPAAPRGGSGVSIYV